MILIGSCAGTFYALDKNTGQVRWKYDIRKDGDQNNFHGDPLITEDLIIIGTDGGSRPTGIGSLYAFEKETGKVRWRYNGGRGVATDILRIGSSIYAVTLSDEFVCLDLKSGQVNWTFRSEATSQNSYMNASPVGKDDRVYFGGLDGKVYALDSRSGRLIWKRDFGARISRSFGMLGDHLYVGSANGHFYRLNRKTGDILNDFSAGAETFGPPIFTHDSVIVLFGSKAVVCLDLALKDIRWSNKASTEWSSSRPYLWRDTILAGDEDGELFAFLLADGSRQWSQKFDKVIRGIGTSKEVLYVGTLRGKVYAFLPKRARRAYGKKTTLGKDLFSETHNSVELVSTAPAGLFRTHQESRDREGSAYH